MRWIAASVFPLSLFCLPIGGEISRGAAAFNSPSPEVLEIAASDRAILEWQNFSIEPNEWVRFLQPNTSSSVLNRVIENNPSLLLGRLESNGQILLTNPNGILVGKDARIDTGSFIASTLDLLNGNFSDGFDLAFSGDSEAEIVNYGKIHTTDGEIGLFALHVKNEGSLQAPAGDVLVGSAPKILLQSAAHPRIFIDPKIESQAQILNTGSIKAAGVEISAFRNVYGMAFSHEGSIDALDMVDEGGHVYLTTPGGLNQINGSISARNSNGTGGVVHILGGQVHLLDDARIDISGESGGGTALIGGSEQGKDPAILNSAMTFVGSNVKINADCLQNGDGGKVILWSDGVDYYYGGISAKGGGQSGNGGFSEVSGLQYLDFGGRVDLTSPFGKTGTLLLDPPDISINPGGPTTGSFSGCSPPSTYTPGVLADTLSIGALLAALATCDVVVSAPAGNITLATLTGINMTPANNNNLTLNAGGNIVLSPGSAINNSTTANGNIALIAAGSITTGCSITFSAVTVGNLTMTAGGGVTIQNNAPINLLGASNFTINDDFDSCNTVTTSILQTIQNYSTGDVVINKPGAGIISLNNSAGVGLAIVAVGSQNGTTLIDAPLADVRLEASPSTPSQLGFYNPGGAAPWTATGDIVITCYNLFLTGFPVDMGGNPAAQVGHGRPDVTIIGLPASMTAGSDITITAANDVILQAGDQNGNARIGHGWRYLGSSFNNQDGDITVTAGRNITLSLIPNPMAATNSAWIGHGSVAGPVVIDTLSGNISLRSGCDINMITAINNAGSTMIGHGYVGTPASSIMNLIGDIDIQCGRDLLMSKGQDTTGSLTGGPYVGHAVHALSTLASVTGDYRIRVGRDMLMISNEDNAPIVVGSAATAPSPLVMSNLELIVNRDLTMASAVASGSSAFTIGYTTPNAMSVTNVFVAAGRDIVITAGHGRMGIEASGTPANVAVSAGRNIEVSFFPGAILNCFIGTNNFTSLISPGNTRIWAGGHILGTNGPLGLPQVVFGFGSIAGLAPPMLNTRTASLDMRAGGDLQYSSHSALSFQTANAGTLYLSANNDFSGTPLWTNSASTLTAIAALPLPLPLGNSLIPGLPTACLGSCNCTAAANSCTPPICPSNCGTSASPFYSTNGPTPLPNAGSFYVLTNLPNNNVSLITDSGFVTIHSGCFRENNLTAQNLSIGSIADSAADTVQVFSNSGNVTVGPFQFLNINQTPSFPSPIAPVLNYSGSVELSSCLDTNVNAPVATTLNGTIFINAGRDLNVLANITAGDGFIHTCAGRNTDIFPNIDVTTAGEILMISGLDMVMEAGSTVVSTASTVTLVVDDIHPVAPPPIETQPPPFGRFNLFPGSQVSSGPTGPGTFQPLRMFSAFQSLNTIDGLLNGTPFVLGTLFQNTNQEQWCTFFPGVCNNGNVGGFFFGGPFCTVFYKDCLEQVVMQAMVVNTELLYDLTLFSKYPGIVERFTVDYQPDRKGPFSSLSYLSKEPYYLRRPSLRIINLPKDETTLNTFSPWLPE